MTAGSGLDETVRQLRVECDWCGRMLAGKVRRSEVGRMIVVQEKHADAKGRPCLGTGRALGSWPLGVEVSVVRDGYSVRIGVGRPRVCVGREGVVATLLELGVVEEQAHGYVSGVRPGHTVVLDVPERRVQPRSRGES